MADKMMGSKKFVGTVCEHHQRILEEKDAHCVEFKDVVGDVCSHCFSDNTEIKNTNNPYDGNISDYWFDGTLAEYKDEGILIQDVTFTLALKEMTKARYTWIMALLKDVGTGDINTETYNSHNTSAKLTEKDMEIINKLY